MLIGKLQQRRPVRKNVTVVNFIVKLFSQQMSLSCSLSIMGSTQRPFLQRVPAVGLEIRWQRRRIGPDGHCPAATAAGFQQFDQ
jgi:hypothetical protein